MKKLICVSIMAVFFMVASGISFGEESSEVKGSMKHIHEGMKEGDMEGIMPKHCMMVEECKEMVEKSGMKEGSEEEPKGSER